RPPPVRRRRGGDAHRQALRGCRRRRRAALHLLRTGRAVLRRRSHDPEIRQSPAGIGLKGTTMNREDMILISADDHIIDPPDMFVNHLPSKYADDAPRLVHREDGTDVWKFRDVIIPNAALNAVAGRPKEEYGLEPQGLDEIRPGCYDVHERVKDMNAG